MASQRGSYRFSGSVAAGDSIEETAVVEADATIEEVRVRFYQGPRLGLRVDPFKKLNGRDKVSLVTFIGRDYIVGDNDHWVFPISEPVEEDDVIGVDVENTEDFAYDYVVDMILDEEGGTSRPIASLVDSVRGWF